MRNLTKVLAMVLAFTMMVSVAAFAATYTDVASDANYAEAVSVLSDLGLVKGYEDGTFGADKTLTRAEAATLVVRLMGLEDAAVSAAGSDTGFTDVPADHWASGYITVAASKSVVAGMGDGTFEPETELEYAQIVKMIVVALGYEPQAAEAGEWPTNYISTASSIGLTKGIAGKASDKVSRATTARLLYAALTIPKMAKSGVGVTATFEPTDTLILDDLGIYKLLGSVSAVDSIEEKATIVIDKQGLALDKKYKETADEDDWTYDSEETNVETGVLTATLKGMIGVPAYIFVADVDGDLTIVSVVERKNISSVSFTTEDYKEYDSEKAKLTIYVDEAQVKTTSIKLADEIEVRTNGDTVENISAAAFVTKVTTEGLYLVDLKDTEGSDDKYDYANLTEFSYMVVGEVDVNKDETVYKFTSEEDFGFADDAYADLALDEIKIDLENEETAITIIKDNAVIEAKDIAEGDILNIIINEIDDTTDELIEGTIYVTNDTVEGVVQYVDDVDKLIVLEDGTEFKFIDDYGVDSNTEATFFFNISGKLIYVGNESSKSAYEYGFVTTLDFEGKRAVKSGTMRVLTTSGEWATLDLKASVKVDDGVDEAESKKLSTIDDSDKWDDFVDLFGTLAADDEYDFTAGTYAIALNKVVAYKPDAAGAVKEIAIIEDGDDAANGWNSVGTITKKFNQDDEVATFGDKLVDETTVVFNKVADYTYTNHFNFEETKISVTNIDIFADGDEYTAEMLIDINEKTEHVSVIVGSFEEAIDFEANYFVVSKVLDRTLKDFDDIEVQQLEGMQNGEKVVYYYSEDYESDVKQAVEGVDEDDEPTGEIAWGGASVENFAAGDVLIVNADTNGFITTAAKLLSVDEFEEYEDEDVVSTDLDGLAVDGEDEGAMFSGFVAKKNASIKTKFYVVATVPANDAYRADEEDLVNFKGAVVTVYDFNETKAANRVYDDSIAEGDFVFGRTDEDGKVKEVVVIRNAFSKTYDI